MRVLVIDPDSARADLVAEGLSDVAPLEVRRASVFDEAEAAAFAPDVVVVAAESSDRDVIESLREADVGRLRPVVMFVDRSEPGLAEAAVRAGVAAYIVDGLSPARVRSILEVAMSRFQLVRRLRDDLDKARADLASRRTIERAKAIVMEARGLDEEAAYRLLRKISMDSGRPLAAVAADFLTFAGLMHGEGM